MKAGYPVPEVQVLFERLDKKVVEEETESWRGFCRRIRYIIESIKRVRVRIPGPFK